LIHNNYGFAFLYSAKDKMVLLLCPAFALLIHNNYVFAFLYSAKDKKAKLGFAFLYSAQRWCSSISVITTLEQAEVP